MCIHVYIYLLIWSSDAGSGPVRRMPSDVECRFRAGSSDAGPPVAADTDHHRIPGRQLPPVPVTVESRAASGPILVGQNLYMWLGNLHF